MSIEQMRQYLLEKYPRGISWVKRLSDGQVFAIYTRLKNKKE